MSENITLEITEKRVTFDPVVAVKTIPANNKGRKVNPPLVQPKAVQRPVVQRPVVQRPVVKRPVVQRPVVQRPVVQRRRFGMQFIR
jgi:hypothetical protein